MYVIETPGFRKASRRCHADDLIEDHTRPIWTALVPLPQTRPTLSHLLVVVPILDSLIGAGELFLGTSVCNMP